MKDCGRTSPRPRCAARCRIGRHSARAPYGHSRAGQRQKIRFTQVAKAAPHRKDASATQANGGDYRAALAHVETAASLYRPDEHRDSAFRYGQDIGVSAFVHLSLALWHCGYPDQSACGADRALTYSRQLGHAHTLAHALYHAGVPAVLARDVATVYARSNGCVALASEHGFALLGAGGRILQGWAEAQMQSGVCGEPVSTTPEYWFWSSSMRR